ncbi:MAG: hypothetical protein SNF33_03530 [Candidatus Algichlamydia australiensis]|nr:hypothetical protein [Chlamydiales bacterium]
MAKVDETNFKHESSSFALPPADAAPNMPSSVAAVVGQQPQAQADSIAPERVQTQSVSRDQLMGLKEELVRKLKAAIKNAPNRAQKKALDRELSQLAVHVNRARDDSAKRAELAPKLRARIEELSPSPEVATSK